MELKDVILSTLAELEDSVEKEEKVEKKEFVEEKIIEENPQNITNFEKKKDNEAIEEKTLSNEFTLTLEDEKVFCESLRERILVLFEGFQSPNNKSIEAKVDLTLNFLEYLLAVIDERLENLDKNK
jgi:hypothetical protein